MKKIVLFVAFFATITSCVQEEEKEGKIAFGPYIQQMTTKSAVICWSTLSSEPTLTDQDGNVKTISEYQQHSIQLGRLNPNTEYLYDVLNDGSDEGKGKFTTYSDEIEPFNFVVLGDTRSRHDVHAKIVNKIIKKDPLLIINTGDLVKDGRVIDGWENFFRINKELMRNVPYYPVLGNHEKNAPYYFDFFDLPNNERYYSFNVGDVLFVILDSEAEYVIEPNYISEENSEEFWQEKDEEYFITQKKWLEQVLELHKEVGFIFVFQHTPLYSVKESRITDAEKRRKFWGDIYERHNVQVFMNGDDHHYHRATKNGVHYITTAGGGAGLYDIDTPQPETVVYKKIEHFVHISINENDAVLNVIDINGNEIDKITIKRRGMN